MPTQLIVKTKGLWGAKVQQRRDDLSRAARKLFNRRMPFFHGIDQLQLKFYVWPLAVKDSVRCFDLNDYR